LSAPNRVNWQASSKCLTRNRLRRVSSLTTARAAEIGNLVICNYKLIETITLAITIGNWHYLDICTQKTQRFKSGFGYFANILQISN